MPESLLHQLERDIDLLLMRHTGNAASSKVTMAQAQSSSTLAVTAAAFSTETSPIVIERIKTLFAESLPLQNLVLLREIGKFAVTDQCVTAALTPLWPAYHLAHLASYSSVTRMTFANLRLILSPTLRLSPVMLTLLVNEREQIFPKPGSLGHNRSETTNDGFSLDFSRNEPKLKLTIPDFDDLMLPHLPEKPTQTSVANRAPYSNAGSNRSTLSIGGDGATVAGKRSLGSLDIYRASWHVVDLPQSRESETDDEALAPAICGTPIARKFIHQRTASAADLFERASSTSPASLTSSVRMSNSSPIQRTPTFNGFSGRSSPSPFFSSGSSPSGLSGHARKRSSASSIGSLQASMQDGTAEWRARRISSMRTQAATIITVAAVKSALQDEEEELSSSDTSTSLSSVDSAATPTDAHDIQVGKPDDDETDDLACRRRTVTAESFGRDEVKRKRGSMMPMNLPTESIAADWNDKEAKAMLDNDVHRYNRAS